MDEARYQELIAKRDGPGLTNDEANELGKLMAEQAGAKYSHAHPVGEEPTEETEDWDEVRDSADKTVNEDEMRHRLVEEERDEGVESGPGGMMGQ
ncbi:MAG TPA: hypothetical protein VGH10_02100 [Actinomycetota bacterium]